MKSLKKKVHDWTAGQARSAQVPNFGKKYIVTPALLGLFGGVKGKKVLEFGSGNGYWLDLLARLGAKCTGIEISDKQIILAQERPGSQAIRYIQADIARPNVWGVKLRSHDVVLLEHVLLEISSLAKLERIMRNAFRCLKKGGRLIISDLHPFAPSAGSKNIRIRKNFHYFESGEIFEIVSTRIDGHKTVYRDYHWTLQDIAMSVVKAGFHLTDVVEPIPAARLAARHPELAYRRKLPMLLMLKAVKP